MRAVVITEPGGPEVLEVIDRPVREPRSGEVRIAVKAAAVNPTDVVLRTSGAEGFPAPWTLGMDAAGIVESVGPEVERLRVGDAVMTAVNARRPEGGAQAELLVAPAASVVPIPDGATLQQAATLPMNGLTALMALGELGLEPGATLAISGGAGHLASFAIPLAKERGLRVVADAMSEDEQLVRDFGADVVVPRGDGFAAAVREVVPGGVDGLCDTAMLYDRGFGAIRDGGTIAVVRGWTIEHPERDIEVKQIRVPTVLERTDWLEHLRALASSGQLQLRVAGEHPPEQVSELHRLMEAGGVRGRHVIVF